MNRRQFASLVVGSGFLAGCLENESDTGTDESPRDDATSSDDWMQEAGNEPAYDRTVAVHNERSDPVEIEVEIGHEGDAGTVHSDRHTVDGDAELEVYDFRDAPTEGVEQYRIAGRLESGAEATFTYATNACMADPGLIIRDETLESLRSEC